MKPTGIRRQNVEKGEKTQPLNGPKTPSLIVTPGFYKGIKPLTYQKETPKYRFTYETFIMTEKASYVNEKKGRRSTVQTIIGQLGGEIYNDAWEVKDITDKIKKETKMEPVNNILEIYQEDIANENDIEPIEIGLCYYNSTSNVYVSENLNENGFIALDDILKKRGHFTGTNLASTIKDCGWTPKCDTETGKYYWVNDEGARTDDKPYGCGMQKEETCKVACDWEVVCSKSKKLPIWQHTTGTKQWKKPECIKDGDPRLQDFEEMKEICKEATGGQPGTGGRRKTRKNKKSKRKTKSRR